MHIQKLRPLPRIEVVAKLLGNEGENFFQFCEINLLSHFLDFHVYFSEEGKLWFG